MIDQTPRILLIIDISWVVNVNSKCAWIWIPMCLHLVWGFNFWEFPDEVFEVKSDHCKHKTCIFFDGAQFPITWKMASGICFHYWLTYKNRKAIKFLKLLWVNLYCIKKLTISDCIAEYLWSTLFELNVLLPRKKDNICTSPYRNLYDHLYNKSLTRYLQFFY